MNSLAQAIRKDWIRIAESVVRKRGKRLEDLCFAKRTENGYAFFEDIHENAIDMLHEISTLLARLYPHVAFAEIADISSRLANEFEIVSL